MRDKITPAAMLDSRKNSKLAVYHSDKYPNKEWIQLLGNREGFMDLIDHIQFMLDHEEIGCIEYENIEPEWGGRLERDSFNLIIEFDETCKKKKIK